MDKNHLCAMVTVPIFKTGYLLRGFNSLPHTFRNHQSAHPFLHREYPLKAAKPGAQTWLHTKRGNLTQPPGRVSGTLVQCRKLITHVDECNQNHSNQRRTKEQIHGVASSASNGGARLGFPGSALLQSRLRITGPSSSYPVGFTLSPHHSR